MKLKLFIRNIGLLHFASFLFLLHSAYWFIVLGMEEENQELGELIPFIILTIGFIVFLIGCLFSKKKIKNNAYLKMLEIALFLFFILIFIFSITMTH